MTAPLPAAGIQPDDIRAAVASGLLNERQAATLTALAHSRRGAREGLDVGDEPFELFRGFNEIFIMVGLSILAFGWFAVCGVWLAGSASTWLWTLRIQAAISAGLLWLLSEYFIRRRRMVGPAILLTVFFAVAALTGLSAWQAQPFMVAAEDYSSLVLSGLLAVLAVLVFWLRFKVPFAMALIALGLFATAIVAAATTQGTPQSLQELFVLSGESGFGWLTLGLGLITFAVAMMFDGSDPHRVTRRSAQGFWLHLVASPMIINTVALSLLQMDEGPAVVLTLSAMTLFAVVAVVIDRRSFLLAAIGYVVGVIVTLNTWSEPGAVPTLLVGLGLFLVVLGAFWSGIRAALLRIVPLGGLHRFLPPAH